MKAEDLITREEGYVPHAYQDHLGYWTIGYGRLIDKRRGGRIRKVEADLMLKLDLMDIEAELDAKIPWWKGLTPARRAVLTSMAYQMGIKGLLKFKQTLRAVRDGDWKKAAKGMRASKWAHQTPGRAERHAKQMETGRWH